jgi:hypothetical protein
MLNQIGAMSEDEFLQMQKEIWQCCWLILPSKMKQLEYEI